jgi:succinate dehydrogenase/fumarate reductase flavoprotein subunit
VTTEYLIQARNALLERMSRPTHPRPDYPELELTVRKRVGLTTVASLPLTFVDPAGELADEAARLLGSGGWLVDRMISASGVVWLFDASVSKVDVETVLRSLSILTGRTEGRVQTPIALCLSKIDLLGPERMQKAIADPRAALAEHLGEDAFDLFRRVFANREHFAISSAGTTTRQDSADRAQRGVRLAERCRSANVAGGARSERERTRGKSCRCAPRACGGRFWCAHRGLAGYASSQVRTRHTSNGSFASQSRPAVVSLFSCA